jgi:hypothetical protein
MPTPTPTPTHTPTPSLEPRTLSDRLADFAASHQFYSWRDVREIVFDNSTDAFVDAWASGILPGPVAKACEDTMDVQWLQVFLLRRISRQMSALLAALG